MDEHQFQDILRFYGSNTSLLSSLLFSSRTPSLQCLSVSDLLAVFGLANVSEVTVDQLELVCPAVLTQVLLPSCPYMTPHSQTIDSKVWGYGFLAVTIINLASLLGLLLIPFTKKSYFPKVLTYFIGVAIGTLFSNAALQLVPEALGFDPKADDYVLKAVGIFGGFYVLFFTERVLKMALKVDSEVMAHYDCHLFPSTATLTSLLCRWLMSQSQTSEACVFLTCRWLRGERVSNIKTVAWMITLSDGLHNFIDGLAIGASFTLSLLTGFSTSIAIVCEEFPHELGDFVILLTSGMSVPQAVFFNLLSAICCYLGLVLGILLGSNIAPNAIFAIAGGMFLYISLADMFPEMNSIMTTYAKGTSGKVIFFVLQNCGLLTGFSVILLITMFAGNINLG
uniref:Solute carrier family 39 member 8 n=1 Tax=Electrophorus electricus TaxID=8005 RepID=A0A4W4GJL3_ELEEL